MICCLKADHTNCDRASPCSHAACVCPPDAGVATFMRLVEFLCVTTVDAVGVMYAEEAGGGPQYHMSHRCSETQQWAHWKSSDEGHG